MVRQTLTGGGSEAGVANGGHRLGLQLTSQGGGEGLGGGMGGSGWAAGGQIIPTPRSRHKRWLQSSNPSRWGYFKMKRDPEWEEGRRGEEEDRD